jgi:hypothetical protein
MGGLRRCSVSSDIRAFCSVGSGTQPGQPARTPAFRRALAVSLIDMMNDIEIIERDLRSRFPEATVTIDAPADPAGTWTSMLGTTIRN